MLLWLTFNLLSNLETIFGTKERLQKGNSSTLKLAPNIIPYI